MVDAGKSSDSIAVVGMAIRFPGDLGDEQSFWRSLREGRDVVSQIDAERWATDRLRHPKRSEPGRSTTFAAGVLSRVDEFDAAFFGISPREASWLDPQQRLLLELAWEALENGGIAPSTIAGSDCAVYVGISGVDYGMRALDDLASTSSHSMTGNTLSIAANRLSYVFDLRGPSVAVDTACSSSLVALHHACNSLRSGESSIALVGGVNLLLHPYPFIGFTKASMLSPTGRCRAFDASGNGYVRGEGGAVFLLKPLRKALSDGDTIQAVILATGANSDGARKTGLTIPSNDGQADLMRGVLSRSGLCANDIDYIEAHGTGTAVGDPIETAAIGQVYGRPRTDGLPLAIGSVKTNLGHLEPASGMAGLAKAILVVKNRAVPPSLHMETPNPHIDFSGLNLEVVTQYRPMADSRSEKMVVGVNSFGFGGANAHVLVQEFRPEQKASLVPESTFPPLFLSARSPKALRELAGRYAELLRQQPQSYYDIAFAAAARRERLDKRLCTNTATSEQTLAALSAFAQGQTVSQLVLEDALAQPGAVAFVYAGNGTQWWGMGRRLLAESPRFFELIAGLDAPIRVRAGFSILEELSADSSTSRLEDTAVAQPLLFAMQVALTTMLRERGVEPQAVTGHSVGEIAAAWAAGALSLDHAVEVICARSAAQALTCGTGRMAAVGLSQEAADEWISGADLNTIEVAGINSPNSVTLSGPLESLERLGQILAQRNVFFRLLDLDYAFHSRAMDPIKDGLLAHLEPLVPTKCGDCSFVSTVTGKAMSGDELGAGYWWRNVRQPVRFSQAIDTLVTQGCRIFVEISPHAILQRYIGECLKAQGVVGRVLSTLRRDDDGLARVEEAALRTHLLLEPHRVDVFFPTPGQAIRLPNYPWQRERYWHPRTTESAGVIERRRIHPLLGWRVKDAAATWENDLDPDTCGWLGDHKVANAIVLPGAAYVEIALAAAREHFGGACQEIEELDILAPIVFDGEHARCTRFELHPRDGGFRVLSRQRLSEDDWTLNAVGRLLGAPCIPKEEGATSTVSCLGDSIDVDHETHYQLTQSVGLDYGPCFQGLGSARVYGRTSAVVLAMPSEMQKEASHYLIHPALLDVCFQSLVDFFKGPIESGQGVPFLPVKMGRVRLYTDATVVQFRTHLRRQGIRSVLADFELIDADNRIVATLESCRFRTAAVQRRKNKAPACWNSVPHLKPLLVEQLQSNVPSSRVLGKTLRSWFAQAETDLDRITHFNGASPLFEAMTVSFVRDAFADAFAGSNDQIQRALGQPDLVEPNLRSFFLWMVRVLQQEGLLVEHPTGGWALESADLPPAHHIWRTLLRDYPANLPELVLAARIGRQLPALMRGQMSSGEFVSALYRSHQFDVLVDDSPAYLGTRLAVQHVLLTVASDWPSDRRLRVLEVVAGNGTSLQTLLAQAPGIQLDYVVAHGSEEAHERLSAEYAGISNVVVARVDRDGLELVADGPIPELFDIIVLQHTLHGANHPVGVMAAARRRLARAGLLLVAERHPDVAADFVFGLDPLWWRSGSGGELVSRLNTPKAWEQALTDQGFVDISTFQESASEGLAAGAYLVMAKRPDGDAIVLAEASAATWLLVCDPTGESRLLADSLRRQLQSKGHRTLLALEAAPALAEGLTSCIPENPAVADALLAAAGSSLGAIDHVVYLKGLGTEAFPTGDKSAQSSDHSDGFFSNTVGLLRLVKALVREPKPPRLWLVTAGGALVEGLTRTRLGDMQQAALWGLGRVVMNEYPALKCTLIDLDIDAAESETTFRLQSELLLPDGEREIVLARRCRYAIRMERMLPAPRGTLNTVPLQFRLDFRVPGQLRNLIWMPQPERAIVGDEIEVRVVATGLNFRDVMYLMGLLPDEAVENGFAGASLGLEFSGVVTRVNKVGSEFAVGDAVMGFGAACFASHVVTQVNALSHKPVEWSFEAAATVPTVFFTVYYALKQLANVQPGERVLIHGAAGGVGIAAVQLALHLGAEIFATVGSAEKRDFVTLLGVDHVFDSRNLAFADEILALTGGEGVDVVLNSLAGEAIRRNLRVLKPFGRFLELGKRDFFENTPIGLRSFKDNISYFGIDADQLLLARPALAGRLFREVMALFREGVLFPLPYRAFAADRVVDAFRAMQQSRHIGKIIVKLEGARVGVESAPATVSKAVFSKNSTWLIAGGLSGFGLESARWLAERGVGRLVLLGRRGAHTPGTMEAAEQLRALGAQVEIAACDITDRAAVQTVLVNIRRDGPPLRGVLHAAMVLDDALIANLDALRMRKVLAPKMLGAWHLHSLTLGIPLEHFVLYSSVTASIGNPGQANYVAANASLEGLAALRRAMGLPATCIGWGPIGDAGYLTRNQAVKDGLASRLGAEPMSAHDALAMLDTFLSGNPVTITVADFDWPTLSRFLPSALEPRFEILRKQAGPASQANGDSEDIHALIAGKSPDEVRSIIQELATKEVAQVLCVGVDRIDPARSLHDMGMDSLMGVELALGLEKRFGIQLPAMVLSEGPSVDRVVARIVDQILGKSDPNTGDETDRMDAMVTMLAAQHGEELSVDDVARTVEQIREQTRSGG